MQEATRPRRIDQELCRKRKVAAISPSMESYRTVRLSDRGQIDLIEVLDAHVLSLADEQMIEVCPVPVGVGNLVVGTCADEKLIHSIGRRQCRLPAVVVIKRKAALQPASDPRVSSLPTAPFSERF